MHHTAGQYSVVPIGRPFIVSMNPVNIAAIERDGCTRMLLPLEAILPCDRRLSKVYDDHSTYGVGTALIQSVSTFVASPFPNSSAIIAHTPPNSSRPLPKAYAYPTPRLSSFQRRRPRLGDCR